MIHATDWGRDRELADKPKFNYGTAEVAQVKYHVIPVGGMVGLKKERISSYYDLSTEYFFYTFDSISVDQLNQVNSSHYSYLTSIDIIVIISLRLSETTAMNAGGTYRS